MPKYLLAIDGGGTKTEAVVCCENGEVLLRILRGPSNPNDIGVDATVEVLTEMIAELLPLAADGDCYLFVGLAGAGNHGEKLREALSQAFPTVRLNVGTDAVNLISGAIAEADGAAIISGTGSVCYVRLGDTLHRIGGWGYLLDSAGSGYDIGRAALERALMEVDGRREKSSVGEIVERFLGRSPDTALSEIYEKGKPFIASLAEPILAAAEKGDFACYDIVEASIRAWSEMLDRAYALIGRPFRVVLGGGVFTHCPWLVVDLSMSLSAPAELSIADMPMVYGAMIEAARQAALSDIGEKRMKNTFKRSYHALTGEGDLPDDDHDEN
jgi:N-acetylglucosamine kinase-like BadF-type ATPase